MSKIVSYYQVRAAGLYETQIAIFGFEWKHYILWLEMTHLKKLESLGIRHIALKVRDIARSTEFYTRVMGYEIEWHPDPKNIYLTSGMDNLALHEDLPASSSESRLDHFGILVSKPEIVDEWSEWIKNQGIKILKEPKTHRDGARSFYFSDPDGNVIQIFFHPPLSG